MFAAEARLLEEDYARETVVHRWMGGAAVGLGEDLSAITMILCFLHWVLMLWDRCTKNRPLRAEVTDRDWRVYHAATREQFGQRI